MRGLKPPPPSDLSFSAACEALIDLIGFLGTTEEAAEKLEILGEPV